MELLDGIVEPLDYKAPHRLPHWADDAGLFYAVQLKNVRERTNAAGEAVNSARARRFSRASAAWAVRRCSEAGYLTYGAMRFRMASASAGLI